MTIFPKTLSSLVLSKILAATPQFVSNFYSHKKIVVHFFIPMLLPSTLPLVYLHLKKLNDQKRITFTHFTSKSKG